MMKTINLNGLSRATGGALKLNLLSVEGWDEVFGSSKRLSVADAYRLEPWLRRAVELRAHALASVPYTIETASSTIFDSDEGEELPDDLALFEDGKACLILAESSLCCAGAAYFYRIYDLSTTPTALQYWIPTHVTPLINKAGLQGFRRIEGGTARMYMAEDVVFLHTLSPYVEMGAGQAEAEAARTNADVLQSLDTFLDGYLDSGLIAATVVATKRKIGDKERAGFLAGWRERFRRKDHQDPLILNSADAEIHQIGGTLQDLANTTISEDQRKSIAAAFGVPHSLLFSDAANYATKERDHLEFMRWTVQPRAELVAEQLNEQLFAAMGYQFQFQFDRLEVYQAEELKKAQQAAAYATALIGLVESGLLEVSEARNIALNVLGVEHAQKSLGADGSISDGLARLPELSKERPW